MTVLFLSKCLKRLVSVTGQTYFKALKAALKSKGSALVQTITIKDELFDQYRRSTDVIRRYIFPGGLLPSPARFHQEANAAGLHVSTPYYFGDSYAKTLTHWLDQFKKQQAQVQALGFDEPFLRLWTFYLASCIGTFRSGKTNVMQVKLHAN